MTAVEWMGFAMAVGITAVFAVLVYLTRLPHTLKKLIYGALALRVVGAWLRYRILFDVYRGSGDAPRYYARGLVYAERFLQFDFSPFYDPTLWLRGQWWGTSFLSFPSGIVLAGIGPSLLGEFVIFSLMAFLGLVGFAVAFHRSHPAIPLANYARWIWFFPSLWYWPSSVGKDALILMGIGLAIAGFVGKRGKVNWLLTSVGVFFVFAIRPQVAAVLIVSFVLAHWLGLEGRWTPRKSLQGALILTLGLGGIWLSMSYMGVEGFDVEGVQAYMEEQSDRAATGGSGVENVGVGITGIPVAMFNILMRPFPWEARNLMALISAMEIFGLWVIIWYRRRNFRLALRSWRSHPLLRVAIPFIVVYSATLGMLVVNLGIIARQRVFLFPFIFLLIEAVPALEKRRRVHRHRNGLPRKPVGSAGVVRRSFPVALACPRRKGSGSRVVGR